MTTQQTNLPVVVIGAGPIGLAAAANLRQRGMPHLVLEGADQPAAGVRAWGHVRLFSSWAELIDPAARQLLETTGWKAPDARRHPFGREWVADYLAPLAELLGDAVRTDHRVTAVTRQGRDLLSDGGRDDAPFVVRADGPDGPVRLLARAVIDATGTLGSPNPLGADGLPTPGEAAAAPHVLVGVPDLDDPEDRARAAGRQVVVVGRGHTAQNALISLGRLAAAEPGTSITWLLRGAVDRRTFGGGVDDQLAARGALGTTVQRMVDEGRISVVEAFRITDVVAGDDGVVLHAEDGRTLEAGLVVAATGYRPDLGLLAELRTDLDPSIQAPRALGPLIDPNVHSCGTVPPHGQAELSHPEPDLYVVGMKSYGRAPTFLALTGYEQVRSVVAHLDGDLEAAGEVRLKLPETGVCGGPGLDVSELEGVDEAVTDACSTDGCEPDADRAVAPAGLPLAAAPAGSGCC